MESRPLSCDSPGPAAAVQRTAQLGFADVFQSVYALGSELAPDVRTQLQLAGVIEPVVGATQRNHAVGVAAATDSLRHEVRRINRAGATDCAAQGRHLLPLLGRCRHQRRRDYRRSLQAAALVGFSPAASRT